MASSRLSVARGICAPSASKLAKRAAGALGEAGAGLVELELGALVTAAPCVGEGDEKVEDEAGLGLQAAGHVVNRLADAAERVEAGVELTTKQALGGLDEQDRGVAFGALTEALGEGVQHVGAGGLDEGLLNQGEGGADSRLGSLGRALSGS